MKSPNSPFALKPVLGNYLINAGERSMKSLLLLLMVCLTGCFQAQKTEEITLQIRTKKTTNHGTPLYVVVKETTMAEHLMTEYHQIATQSFWKEEE